MDPAERKRRLRKVYNILLDLAGPEEVATGDASSDQSQALS
jgi:hypothetical protein